ncbi:MAG TPA: hypothetical protein PKK06_12170 [Phycisphaerae bacterium]|nr:hypothetical protein [Phycisphaerae bacterium]HNU46367.1 hypothetical protein [Phycisphaerae bacterium]
MARLTMNLYLALLIVALATDTLLAAGIGPFSFNFASGAMTSLVLLPLQLAGCL